MGIDNVRNTIEYPPYLRVGCFKNQIKKITNIDK